MDPREIGAILRDDTKVKLAGIDADGVLRGKVMSKDKFLSVTESGFGFCRQNLHRENATN